MQRITQITINIAQYTQTLEQFNELIREHEELVQAVLNKPRAYEIYFEDFWGEIKSLGAWGGDFVLACSDESEEKTRQYFAERGFETVIPYEEMILGQTVPQSNLRVSS
jgi:hypothetical protein